MQSVDNLNVRRWLETKDNKPYYIPQQTREYLLREANERCTVCKKRDDEMHIDHIIPLHRGGSAVLDNLQVLCRSCNLKKGTGILDQRSYVVGYPIVHHIKSEKQVMNDLLDKLESEYA